MSVKITSQKILDNFLRKYDISLRNKSVRLIAIMLLIIFSFSVVNAISSKAAANRLMINLERNLSNRDSLTVENIVRNCQGDPREKDFISSCINTEYAKQTESLKTIVTSSNFKLAIYIVLLFILIIGYMFLLHRTNTVRNEFNSY